MKSCMISIVLHGTFSFLFFFSLAELRLAFSLFDKDRDGNISQAEVKAVMGSLGQQCSDDHLMEMFRQVDLDGKF